MSKQSDLVSVSQGSGGNPLYIDTTNDRVGIGTSLPTQKLEVNGIIASINSGSGTEQLQLQGYGASAYINMNGAGSLIFRMGSSFTERMRIDSSGRVTIPYQPCFSAYVSSSYSASSTASKVLYNSTWINVGSHFNTSTNTFTAPVSGKYKFNSRVSISVSSGEYARAANVIFYVNGSLYGANYHNIRNAIPSVSGTAVYHGLEGSAIISLSANDTVSVYLTWETDGTLDASETVHYHGTYFEGHLIG